VTLPAIGLAVTLEPGQSLSEGSSYQVAMIDADGDSDLDLVFGQYNDYTELWLNDGSGQFVNSGMDLGNAYTSSLYIVDANNDNSPDLFVGGASGLNQGDAQLLLNNGSGNFTEDASVTLSNGEEPGSWAVADVDSDGHLDFALITRESSTPSSTLAIWYGSDSGYPTNPTEHVINDYSCTSLEAADLAGDSADELVVGCSPVSVSDTEYAGGIQIWQHNGTNLTSLTAVLETDWDIGDLAFTDIDSNGDTDIIGTHFNSNTPVSVTGNDHSVWTNSNGTFSAAALDFNGGSLEIADVDGDSRDDLIIADGSTVRLHLGESGASFDYQAGAIETCSAYVQATASGDVNGDGKTDIALASTPYYTTTDPADLLLIQDGTNTVCASSDGGGSTGGGTSAGDDGGSGGGALGTALWLSLGLLSILRMVRNRDSGGV
jgi:hypothetical protein